MQQKSQQQTFFRKAGEESFFGGKEQPSFFNAPIQAKLSISSPDDPQEKEADAVADNVMRMPAPVSDTISTENEKKIDKKFWKNPVSLKTKIKKTVILKGTCELQKDTFIYY